MELALATYENCENSLTPLRRSYLLRRELARERVTKRARLRALRAQAGLRHLRDPSDPLHVIETGDYRDDLRGLVNPDGSIHLWPMDEMTHQDRAREFGLRDEHGYEGAHFYVYLGSNGPSGNDLYGETKDDVTIILNHHGIIEAAKEAIPSYDDEGPYVHIGDGKWDFEPTPPSPKPLRLPHIQWIVVTLPNRVKVAGPGAGVWPNPTRNWTSVEAWQEADRRNLVAMKMGLTVRYGVIRNPNRRKW